MKKFLFSRNFLLLSLFLFSVAVSSQTVKGKVIDLDGNALPFFNVVEKNTNNGTTTDDQGEFSINMSKIPSTLVISLLGYETTEKLVTSTNYLVIEAMESSETLQETIIVGSRNKSRTAVDTPVPVDIINVAELTRNSPQVNLNQILNYVAPSFSSNTQTISDGTDHIDPASLRGLGPDQVLVLVNGKRRHTSSLVNVNGTFGRGSVGTDLNAIPAASIKSIQVLRDGAAAQYGSDAIAGVINIILNNKVNELNLSVTSGAHVSKNSQEQQGGIDGETVNISANYGIALGDKGGYINFTGDFDYRDPYSRMSEFKGQIFSGYNSVEWVANNSGLDLANLSLDDIRFASQGVTHFDLATKNAINNATDLTTIQSLLNFDTTEAELDVRGLNRSDFNMRVGQSGVRGGRFFANMSLPLDDNGTEFYSFSGFSSRTGNSAGFYRLPYQSRTYTPLYINGFLPEINSKIIDKSIAVGIRSKAGDWDVDFSNTWGTNSFNFEISNTSNASLLSASPTRFDAGGFSFTQNTTNLDFVNNYEDIFNGLNVAVGAEYRAEFYDIVAGEEESYTQYDANGLPVTPTTTASTDFFGSSRPGGSQVFPGFTPKNALGRDRNSFAAYIDLEAELTDKLLVSGAARFENYSDFGSTINYKLASRYKVNDNLNLRAGASTGFRAPSLHQRYYNAIATQFIAGVPSEVGTFTNDSDIAQQLGIPSLKEEESASVSFGFAGKIPSANLKITADAYFVAIEDRVILTDRFNIPDGIVTNAEAAAFFANAIDTESMGLDIVVTHKFDLNESMRLSSDLSATFSKTRRVDDIHSSQVLVDSGQESSYFSEASRIYLEEAVPRTKVNLSNTLSTDRFNVFLRNVYFGEVTEASNNVASQQVYGAKLVTDLSVGFKATEELTFTVGANNIFDIYPDRTDSTNSNFSSGRFEWSRRSQQFGIGGRFLFARLNFILN
ncbi:iron complex outermembrane recepter protein [Tenacibaculum sp. MAR_2009_124]|uniref:TonB-dependent receptor n=1 Tax=Tenacibaculum sp. MAR_2009_124 TaxID=1250059 RepID=UPI0008988D29|nr:TonB-dependent receptor [Tenacibaculum sp. MAR_2009_124]SEC49166.1 iron complex outermembrane recepter protein [Tenacibaculum sp. MAR_2009_124]